MPWPLWGRHASGQGQTRMKSPRSDLDMFWLNAPAATEAGAGARPATPPSRSRSEAKSDETTRVAREMIDAATEARHARTARLRLARLGKEAEEKAQAPSPVKRRSTRT